MSKSLDIVLLLLSLANVAYLVRAKRKQVALTREVDALRNQLRSVLARLDGLATSPAANPEAMEMDRVRHDLRNPLTTIVGFCALLKQTSTGFTPKQERMLDNIDNGARQMLELVGVSHDDDSRP